MDLPSTKLNSLPTPVVANQRDEDVEDPAAPSADIKFLAVKCIDASPFFRVPSLSELAKSKPATPPSILLRSFCEYFDLMSE